jgi:hypothetical protein
VARDHSAVGAERSRQMDIEARRGSDAEVSFVSTLSGKNLSAKQKAKLDQIVEKVSAFIHSKEI